MECENSYNGDVQINHYEFQRVDIKEEPFDTDDLTDEKMMMEKMIVTVNNIKVETNMHIFENNLLDNKITVQESFISYNNVKKEFSHSFYCETCSEEFEMYCINCTMLSRILDNTVRFDIDNRPKETIPKNILALGLSSGRIGVFALRTIPKNVIFGPFEGLKSTCGAEGSIWKLKSGNLIVGVKNFKLSNWMQYVNHATQVSEQNLNVFQCNKYLYYRSICKINQGDQLLVHFDAEQFINNLDNVEGDTERYIQPVKEKEIENVYACTFCCIGFRSETYLTKHKTVCPNKTNINISCEEIMQCSFCKIYMERTEYMKHHIGYCGEKFTRQCTSPISFNLINESKQKSYGPRPNNSDKQKIKKHKCLICAYETAYISNLKKHHDTHIDIKPYECPKCDFKTKAKERLKRHQILHEEVKVKPFQCQYCHKYFTRRYYLKIHVQKAHVHDESKHEGGDVKHYECPKCPYKTYYKANYDNHINTHEDVKPFTCEMCQKRFSAKRTLYLHMKYVHRNIDKKYKCEKCSYQANRKQNLKSHLFVHEDFKQYSCPKCPYQSSYKSTVNRHMVRKH